MRQVLIHCPTEPDLLERSEAAQLIVVGTRGHGRFVSLLLGSTSLSLIAHAACPVIVAAPHPTD